MDKLLVARWGYMAWNKRFLSGKICRAGQAKEAEAKWIDEPCFTRLSDHVSLWGCPQKGSTVPQEAKINSYDRGKAWAAYGTQAQEARVLSGLCTNYRNTYFIRPVTNDGYMRWEAMAGLWGGLRPDPNVSPSGKTSLRHIRPAAHSAQCIINIIFLLCSPPPPAAHK